jgi:hypothetical protein
MALKLFMIFKEKPTFLEQNGNKKSSFMAAL